jgi:ArsR family transcriptional regulator
MKRFFPDKTIPPLLTPDAIIFSPTPKSHCSLSRYFFGVGEIFLNTGRTAGIIRYMAKYRNNSLGEMTAVFRALGDESRARILMSLLEGELCVCRIIGLLDLAPSTVSKHLQILKAAGLINCRKDGRWIHYRLSEEGRSAANGVIDFVKTALKEDPLIRDDRKRLKQLKREDPERLCRRILGR